ncbi:MAG: 3-keto-disaccharide hydrolase [Fimbriimonas sp.]
MAHDVTAILGRWDLTVGEGEAAFPSWVEISQGEGGYEGRFVGIWGSSRSFRNIAIEGDHLLFSLPSQYEGFPGEQVFSGTLTGETLAGVTNTKTGSILPWTGKRQAVLTSKEVTWGEPINLIGSHELDGWTMRSATMENNWSVVNGELVNVKVGSDIVTAAKFGDFKLDAEYSYPKDSNSGIYLRGRYELQILDDYGQEPTSGHSGGIYGFLTPTVNAIKPFGEKNTIEITLIGREVTVVLNGITIHDKAEIPGITGGALDSDEGEPGPLFLQGDHGPVTFHKLVLTPAV